MARTINEKAYGLEERTYERPFHRASEELKDKAERDVLNAMNAAVLRSFIRIQEHKPSQITCDEGQRTCEKADTPVLDMQKGLREQMAVELMELATVEGNCTNDAEYGRTSLNEKRIDIARLIRNKPWVYL